MQANLYAKHHEIKALLAATKTMEEKTDKLTGEITDEDEFDKAQRRKAAILVLSSKHFPQPWDNFGKEVMKRTLNTDIATLQNELRGLDNYDEDFRLSVKPIFVSREIRHKIRGEAHESKLRSNRNRNGKKAFNPPFKLYKGPKQDKNGNPISPVAAVKVYDKKGVVSVGRKANAPVALAEMVRIRVYKKDNQIYMIPDYRINILENKETMELLKPLKKVLKIDNSFNFIGYLYKGDLITIQKDSQTFVGYFVQFEGDNRITIKNHLAVDSSRDSKSTVKRESLSGINYLKIHKVDVLGDVNFSEGIVWPGAS